MLGGIELDYSLAGAGFSDGKRKSFSTFLEVLGSCTLTFLPQGVFVPHPFPAVALCGGHPQGTPQTLAVVEPAVLGVFPTFLLACWLGFSDCINSKLGTSSAHHVCFTDMISDYHI